MVRLLLVRHGVTTWNAQHRYQGHTDVPLSEVGVQQAVALAERLSAEKIHSLYSSDLDRAQTTARVIAQHHNLPVRVEPRLRDIHFGAWEGLSYQQIQDRYAEEYAAWKADPMVVAPPGGETLAQVAERVRVVLDQVASRHPNETVLITAHGGVLQVLLCLVLGLEPRGRWQFRLDNTSLSEVLLYGEGGVLTKLNDTVHLDGEGDDR